uniref:Uncharacterized protein n=1 Tax=Arcella intermedia TaxID=1963864 RepID=A0A6B2KZE7_9EUKA
MIQSNSKECAILKAKTGEYIYKNGSEPNELYVLLKGKASRILNLYFDKEVVLFPGSIMGEYSLLSGQNRSSSVRALTRCEYVKITREAIIELTSDKPLSLLSFPKAMATEIINHFKSLEYGYEYFTLRNGESCVRPGDTPNDFYFLVKGRLRESRPDNGKLIHIREYSIPGATIGITRLLENKPHNSLITAVRDTELVRLDKAWITQLMRTNPSGIQNLIRISLHHEDIERSNDEAMAPKRLVAIIPLYSQVPINGFTSHLVESLRKNAKVRVLSESSIVKKFGKIHNLDLLSNERQNVWHYITGQETINDFVICIAKPNLSPWTRWILQQVDCILVVGHANLNCSGLTEWERTLGLYDSNSYLAEKRLVLLHKPNATIKDTRIALEHRRIGNAPVTFHHHIYEGNQLHYDSIARFLSGTAVGLVLGGGGARGLTHIGVIQALHELGIPIDIVGGTSIGSQVGSLVANEMPASQISQRMCSTYSYLWKTQFGRYTDLTLPYLSLTTGSFVSSNFQKFLNGNSRIEDLRLPFFCVSCNLTKVEPKIHTSGILWEALRASSSLPLVFPPFVSEGDVLVDGGYVNNVPADIMRKIYGANVIIAVDVGDNYHITMDDSINNASGWKILFDTTFRGKSCVNIYEVLLHLAGITDWVNQVSRPRPRRHHEEDLRS